MNGFLISERLHLLTLDMREVVFLMKTHPDIEFQKHAAELLADAQKFDQWSRDMDGLK